MVQNKNIHKKTIPLLSATGHWSTPFTERFNTKLPLNIPTHLPTHLSPSLFFIYRSAPDLFFLFLSCNNSEKKSDQTIASRWACPNPFSCASSDRDMQISGNRALLGGNLPNYRASGPAAFHNLWDIIAALAIFHFVASAPPTFQLGW